MTSGQPLDPSIFRRIFAAQIGFVQYVAASAGWTGAAADDVVQETFLRFYQRPPQALDDRAVRAWLATTARRVIVDMARRQRRERGTRGEAAEPTTGALWFREPETMERELELLAVREMVEEIAALPGGEDFRAFYVEGLKARDIAARHGEAVSTVTTRLSRLRARFRERLATRLQGLNARRA